jgi:hypothetical protein
MHARAGYGVADMVAHSDIVRGSTSCTDSFCLAFFQLDFL